MDPEDSPEAPASEKAPAGPETSNVTTTAEDPPAQRPVELATRLPVVSVPPAVDLFIGAGLATLSIAVSVGQRATRIAAPVVGLALRPPLIDRRYYPERWVDRLTRTGHERRVAGTRDLERLLDAVVPAVVDQVVRRIDLTELVQRSVDLDEIVSDVDLNAAVAGLDLDAVVARLDIDAVLDRLDLTAIVKQRVDLDGIVADVDIEAVINRLDLAGLAEEVIAAIDLPKIIRESTGSVASETVRGVRMRSIAGDEAIGRAFDRILMSRRERSTQAPQGPESNGSTTSPTDQTTES